MKVIADKGWIGVYKVHPFSSTSSVIAYDDGHFSAIPKGFFINALGDDIASKDFGTFSIGKGSKFGVGSTCRYDFGIQSLKVGRYVDAGQRVRFVLNAQHPIGTISTYLFAMINDDLTNHQMPQYSDTILKNDIWIGDEVLVLGGSTIENGCVIGARALIPPNFSSEPYGIYAGSPAKLIRFRFSEKIRESLLELSWWDMPLSWIKENNHAFLVDLTQVEESHALDILNQLKESKAAV